MQTIHFTIKQIADILQGKVIGDENTIIKNIAGIQDATPNDISFLSNKKYEKYLETTQAGCVIIGEDVQEAYIEKTKSTLIKVKNSYLAFTILLQKYQEITTSKQTGISENSFIDPSAKIEDSAFVGVFSHIGTHSKVGQNTQISPQVFIGNNVSIGKDCIIYPGVKIMDGSIIGNRVILQPGVVIGGDGFGFAPKEDGSYMKIPQIGIVVIEDDVEIGSNTTIDRATLGKTIIHQGVKLDNLIQIAHNVGVGKHTVMAAQVGIAGSTSIGDHCLLGGQVGIVGHLKIGNKVYIGSQSGITNNLEDKSKVLGSPAINVTDFARTYAYQKKLASLFKRVEELEKKLAELEK